MNPSDEATMRRMAPWLALPVVALLAFGLGSRGY